MRYSQQKVRIAPVLAPSGQALREKLAELGYEGPSINWGHTKYEGVNPPEAIKLTSNKKKALFTLIEAEVPTPAVYERYTHIENYPVIGRTSYHMKGSGFWYCEDEFEARNAQEAGATHFLEYVDTPREFRVHVVGGNSIKISEKHKTFDPETGEFTEGAWTYPERFKRKISLRKIAKSAVETLGLDFGAVDILYKKIDGTPTFFVLEVNTGPCLTDSENDDTLNRYAEAFYATYN